MCTIWISTISFQFQFYWKNWWYMEKLKIIRIRKHQYSKNSLTNLQNYVDHLAHHTSCFFVDTTMFVNTLWGVNNCYMIGYIWLVITQIFEIWSLNWTTDINKNIGLILFGQNWLKEKFNKCSLRYIQSTRSDQKIYAQLKKGSLNFKVKN